MRGLVRELGMNNPFYSRMRLGSVGSIGQAGLEDSRMNRQSVKVTECLSFLPAYMESTHGRPRINVFLVIKLGHRYDEPQVR